MRDHGSAIESFRSDSTCFSRFCGFVNHGGFLLVYGGERSQHTNTLGVMGVFDG